MKTEIYLTRQLCKFIDTWGGQYAGWCVVEIVEHYERSVGKGGVKILSPRIEIKRSPPQYVSDRESKRDPTRTQAYAIAAAIASIQGATRVLVSAAEEKPNWVWRKPSIYAEKKLRRRKR